MPLSLSRTPSSDRHQQPRSLRGWTDGSGFTLTQGGALRPRHSTLLCLRVSNKCAVTPKNPWLSLSTRAHAPVVSHSGLPEGQRITGCLRFVAYPVWVSPDGQSVWVDCGK